MYMFDEEQIRLEIAGKVPGIYELRILMNDFYCTKLSAYFNSEDPDVVIAQIVKWRYPRDCCINFFLTSNPCKDYCEAREQFDSLRKSRVMTSDDDIERLTWLVLDVDPEHPAGTSATDAEKATAKEQAGEVLEYMRVFGFDPPEIVDSGNGYHLKYGIDLPNDDEGRKFLAAAIDSVHERFPMVDPATKNPSRVLKLPGTLAMKGRSTDARPHRMARIIKAAGVVVSDGQ